MNNQTNTVVKTKPVSKTQKAWTVYRSVMNDSSIKPEDKNKTIRDRFQTDEVGLSDKGANTYMSYCKDRAAGKDPHAGRKLANKNRAKLLKEQKVDSVTETVSQPEVEQPTVDLSNRWLVGSDKENLTGSFTSRAQAQKFAKDNNIKWFDGQK